MKSRIVTRSLHQQRIFTDRTGGPLAVAEQPGAVESPHDEWFERPSQPYTPPSPRSHLGAWLTGLVALVTVAIVSPIVALGLYQYEHVGRVYQGVSVLGVDLSGRTRDEATQILTARAAELTARPVLVRAGDNQWRTDWGKLGLSMPVTTIVDRAMAV